MGQGRAGFGLQKPGEEAHGGRFRLNTRAGSLGGSGVRKPVSAFVCSVRDLFFLKGGSVLPPVSSKTPCGLEAWPSLFEPQVIAGV